MLNKISKHIIIGLIVLIAILCLKSWHEGTKSKYEIKSLGASYLFYDSKICPNKSKLDEIRAKYSKTFDDSDANSKQFIEANFDKLFMEGCVESERRINES